MQDTQGSHLPRIVLTLYLLPRYRGGPDFDERFGQGSVWTILAIHCPGRNGSIGTGYGDTVRAIDDLVVDHASPRDIRAAGYPSPDLCLDFYCHFPDWTHFGAFQGAGKEQLQGSSPATGTPHSHFQ